LTTRAIEHLNQLAANEQAETGSARYLDLWVPSESILVFELELPRVSRRKLEEMLPWMLEERLLGSPEEFEFIPGPSAGSASLVFVVPRSELSRWLLLAQSHGGIPARMAPDYLALAYEEGRWSICLEAGRMLVRTGAYTGFAADIETGWAQLELLARQQPEPPKYSCLQKGEVSTPEYFADKLDTQSGAINWAFTELPIGINLLPSRLKPKKSSVVRQWWPVAASFAFLFVLTLSYLLVQSWAWQKDIGALNQGVSRAYEQLFGEPLRGPAEEAASLAEAKMRVLEHQYINMQRPPLAQMVSLDRIFSTCVDCDLLALEQTENGIQVELQESEQIKARLAGIPEWEYRWEATDTEGVSRLFVEDQR
jgi:type II secretion system protein L